MESSRRSRTRDRLVRAAAAVVAEYGFHAATVDAIAEKAEFSIGALYGNFASKDELFFAVFDDHVRWFEDQVAATATAEDRAVAARKWLTLLATQPEQFLVFVEFWAYAVRRPEVKRELAKRMKQMRSTVFAAAGAGRDAELIALLALAAARGLALEKIADARAVPDREATEFLTALLP